ncbi:uncharacterized protein LOC144162598 isoform X4 [Haemaphysalis longicornis]
MWPDFPHPRWDIEVCVSHFGDASERWKEAVSNCNFIHAVQLVLPGMTKVPEDVNSWMASQEYHVVQSMPVKDLVSWDFVQTFARQGKLHLLSVNTSMSEGNCVAVTPAGQLWLSLQEDVFHGTGLEYSHLSSSSKEHRVYVAMGEDSRTSHASTPRKRQGASLEITSFFTKLPKESHPGSSQASTSSNGTIAATGDDSGTSDQVEETAGTAIPVSEYDIGLYVNCADIPDDVKDRAYSKAWTPPSDYEFQPSVFSDGKTRKFSCHWLQRYKWFAFSDVQKGAFCKTCVLFCAKAEAGKGAHQPCRSLMTTPFRKWKHAIETFESHSRTDYGSHF